MDWKHCEPLHGAWDQIFHREYCGQRCVDNDSVIHRHIGNVGIPSAVFQRIGKPSDHT